jgi:hypothetical protein
MDAIGQAGALAQISAVELALALMLIVLSIVGVSVFWRLRFWAAGWLRRVVRGLAPGSTAAGLRCG